MRSVTRTDRLSHLPIFSLTHDDAYWFGSLVLLIRARLPNYKESFIGQEENRIWTRRLFRGKQNIINSPTPKVCNNMYQYVWIKYQISTLNFSILKPSGMVPRSSRLWIYLKLITEHFCSRSRLQYYKSTEVDNNHIPGNDRPNPSVVLHVNRRR